MLHSIIIHCARAFLCLNLLLCSLSTTQAEENTDSAIWDELRSGQGIALIRHALAPGNGDPDNFVLNDCSTQRNLSDTGREQSRSIGKLFKDQSITEVRLHSSQWCRCLETAELMALAKLQPNPLLNSFFANRSAGPRQLAKLSKWLKDQPTSDKPLVLITHQVVITGLTGVFPTSGEIVVIQQPTENAIDIKVLGTLKTL